MEEGECKRKRERVCLALIDFQLKPPRIVFQFRQRSERLNLKRSRKSRRENHEEILPRRRLRHRRIYRLNGKATDIISGWKNPVVSICDGKSRKIDTLRCIVVLVRSRERNDLVPRPDLVAVMEELEEQIDVDRSAAVLR